MTGVKRDKQKINYLNCLSLLLYVTYTGIVCVVSQYEARSFYSKTYFFFFNNNKKWSRMRQLQYNGIVHINLHNCNGIQLVHDDCMCRLRFTPALVVWITKENMHGGFGYVLQVLSYCYISCVTHIFQVKLIVIWISKKIHTNIQNHTIFK